MKIKQTMTRMMQGTRKEARMATKLLQQKKTKARIRKVTKVTK